MITLKKALLVVAFASQLISAGSLVGQPPAAQWQLLPVDKMAAADSSKALAMLKGKESAPDAALIKRYIGNEFARFCNVTPETETAGFASIRTNLIAVVIRGAQSEAAKKIAADHVVTLAKGVVANPRFHNAGRVNALLALTELELISNSPYVEAFKPLASIAADENQPLALRSIAIYGLNRHAKFTKLSPAYINGLATIMTTVVSSQPKSPIDAKAHAWMVRRGFDVLSTMATAHAAEPAIARLLDDKELPSVRLAAAEYLPRIDQSKLKLTDDQKLKYFIGLAQLTEQQLVAWYEREEDITKMKSGATGMMGGMGMGGMGDMGGGEGGSMDGYGGGMESGGGRGMGGMGMGGMGEGGMGEGGMGGMGMGMGMGGMQGPKPKPLETQPWEVRLTRRGVNQLLQIAHVALDGKPLKGSKPISTVGKGLVDLGLPAEISAPASELLKSVESLQGRINDSTKITTMQSLLFQTTKPIQKIMDLVREVPSLIAQYPKYEKKDELNEIAEPPKSTPPVGDETTPPGEAGATPGPNAAEGGEAGKPEAGKPEAGN